MKRDFTQKINLIHVFNFLKKIKLTSILSHPITLLINVVGGGAMGRRRAILERNV